MSQKNLEIVRSSYEAFLRWDVSGSLSYVDPYVVFDSTRVRKLDVSVAYGHEGVTQAMRHYIGAFEDYHFEVERLTDLGSGAVLAVVTETGRGKSSGVPVRLSFALLYTVIDGKIARITLFPTETQALEAAGLSD